MNTEVLASVKTLTMKEHSLPNQRMGWNGEAQSSGRKQLASWVRV